MRSCEPPAGRRDSVAQAGSVAAGAIRAAALAGPIFATMTGGAILYLNGSQAISVTPAGVAGCAMLMVPVLLVGAIIGLPATAIGGLAMAALGG